MCEHAGQPLRQLQSFDSRRDVLSATTIRDTVKAQLAIASALNIRHINTLLGGSCGGYQALEFAHAFTGTIDHMVLLATGAREMPWNKAIHEAMRLTLKTDPTLEQGDGQRIASSTSDRDVELQNCRSV